LSTRVTPADVAAAMRATAPAAPRPPVPAAPATAAVPFDRVRWEQAVMSSGLHSPVRLVGLALAHYALGGHLPAGGIQTSPRLAERTALSPQTVRSALRDLERAGLIVRPRAWPERIARPVTLTLPAAAPCGAEYTVPHPDEESPQ
jgi:hypothetical protein